MGTDSAACFSAQNGRRARSRSRGRFLTPESLAGRWHRWRSRVRCAHTRGRVFRHELPLPSVHVPRARAGGFSATNCRCLACMSCAHIRLARRRRAGRPGASARRGPRRRSAEHRPAAHPYGDRQCGALRRTERSARPPPQPGTVPDAGEPGGARSWRDVGTGRDPGPAVRTRAGGSSATSCRCLACMSCAHARASLLCTCTAYR